MTTRVTVLMSVYNGSSYLAEAIESIINQTFYDFEFIIYDDASTDDTSDIIRRYKDPRIVVRTNSENQGLTQNLADGVNLSASDYIARMDADDIAHPDRLKRQVEYLDAHPDIDVLGSNVYFFKGTSQFLGKQPETHEDISVYLFFGFTMLHPTIMLRRKALIGSGLNYNPEFRYSQDLDLWVRMLPDHKFANLQDPLLWLREHDQKISRASRSEQQRFTESIRYRLLFRVCDKISKSELKVFVKSERGEILESAKELLTLQNLLLRLMANNNHKLLYRRDIFDKYARFFFYDACRRKLKSRTEVGMPLSLLDLKSFTILNSRQLARLAIICLFSFLNANKV